MKSQKFLADASFLVSAIGTRDPNHLPCYTFFKNNETAQWLIPTIAYFEFQATQSKIARKGGKAYRSIILPNHRVIEISLKLIKKATRMNLLDCFSGLHGADLIYACIAKIEKVPLVTCDSDFSKYSKFIEIINPLTQMQHECNS